MIIKLYVVLVLGFIPALVNAQAPGAPVAPGKSGANPAAQMPAKNPNEAAPKPGTANNGARPAGDPLAGKEVKSSCVVCDVVGAFVK